MCICTNGMSPFGLVSFQTFSGHVQRVADARDTQSRGLSSLSWAERGSPQTASFLAVCIPSPISVLSAFTDFVSYLNISGKVLLICWNYNAFILTCWNYYTTIEDQCNVRSILYVVNNIGIESMLVTIKKLIEGRLWVVPKLHMRNLGTNFTRKKQTNKQKKT